MKTSVALCTYNGEKYIEEQLNSILNQSLPVNEIIICDDISNDRTPEIINKYRTTFPDIIKFYINEKNLGSMKNFEKAILLCSNEVIFLSDQDDIWHPEKVKHFVEYFDENPKIDVIASNGYCIDENSQVHEKYSVWDVPRFLEEKNIPFNYYKIICYVANIATGATMAFRKSICNEIFPFPIMKNFHHDEWIAILASKRNAFVMLNEKYLYYRIHENQQVGGVFYEKTDETKRMLVDLFNYNNESISFKNLKISIKKMINAYNRNKKLLKLPTNYDVYFKENLIEIKSNILFSKMLMKKKYPILSLILSISDKFLGKRKFTV